MGKQDSTRMFIDSERQSELFRLNKDGPLKEYQQNLKKGYHRQNRPSIRSEKLVLNPTPVQQEDSTGFESFLLPQSNNASI